MKNMESDRTYLPIHAFAGLYCSPIEQHMAASSQPQNSISNTSKVAKKPAVVPMRIGKRKADLKAKYSLQTSSNGRNAASPCAHPAQVQRRNERERNRVRQLNSGFATLRQHVPSGKTNKKMSKVDTLRNALDHISHLQALLAAYQQECPGYTGQASVSDSTPCQTATNPGSDRGREYSGTYGMYPDFTTSSSSTDFVKTEDDFMWM